jgi:hypothetical protein
MGTLFDHIRFGIPKLNVVRAELKLIDTNFGMVITFVRSGSVDLSSLSPIDKCQLVKGIHEYQISLAGLYE